MLACVGALFVDGNDSRLSTPQTVMTKAPPASARRSSIGQASTSAAISATPGEPRIGRHRSPAVHQAARSTCFNGFDVFKGTGSFFAGLQAGYNFMLPTGLSSASRPTRRFQAFKIPMEFRSAALDIFLAVGPESYQRDGAFVRHLRGRIGYAPGNWLLYATGGFAWSYDQLTRTQLGGTRVTTRRMPFLWRLGWTAGAGIEVPVAPHWTASIQYLYSDFGHSNVLFANAGQRFNSDLVAAAVAAGLNYQFGDDTAPANVSAADRTRTLSIFTVRPRSPGRGMRLRSVRPIRAPIASLADGRDARPRTQPRMLGLRLWQGGGVMAEPGNRSGIWTQGIRSAVAGYTSGEAYKIGFDYPYTRLQRAFIRQTIDLGGESAESGRWHQSVCREPDGQPPRDNGREIQRRRHLRQQQIRA